MENKLFKTNINCNNCVAKVTESLDALAGKDNWTVDISNPEKILTVTKDHLSTEDIMNVVKKTGFKIAEIN